MKRDTVKGKLMNEDGRGFISEQLRDKRNDKVNRDHKREAGKPENSHHCHDHRRQDKPAFISLEPEIVEL